METTTSGHPDLAYRLALMLIDDCEHLFYELLGRKRSYAAHVQMLAQILDWAYEWCEELYAVTMEE